MARIEAIVGRHLANRASSSSRGALAPRTSAGLKACGYFCFAFLSAATLLAGQATFRTGVEHVAVDVVVTDKSDAPLTDLRKEEFEIVENGRKQAIADFEFISIPVANRVFDPAAPPAPEPDVVANVAPTQKSRLFVMVVDDLHIIESGIVPVKRVMTDFLKALSADDEVAIVFVGRSNISQNFTTNTGLLLKTVDRVREALGFGLDALARDMSGRPAIEQLSHARSAAFAIKNVAASLAASGHARRAIVYVSAGTNLDPNADPRLPEYFKYKTYFEEMTMAFETARRSNVPVYSLDPRGLVNPGEAVRGPESGGRELLRRIRIQQDNVATIAINTGGRAFINSSDLTKAVNDIVAENGSYYLLGYYPDPLVKDGKFHELKVHVSRPGTRVRARQGYVAPGAVVAGVTPETTVAAALRSGLNVSGLQMRAAVSPLAMAPKGMTSAITVELMYPIEPGQTKLDDTLLVSVEALDPDAKVKASFSRPHSFSGPAPAQGPIPFLMNELIDLPSQQLTVRVAVASRALGRAGMVQMSLDVPKSSDGKLQLSAVSLGLEKPARATVMGADLIKGVLPFQPTTTRTFAATDTLRLFGRVFWKSKDPAPVVTLTVTGVSGALATLTPALGAAEPAAGNQQAILDAKLPLASYQPGSYQLDITARLPNGQTSKRTILFSVR